MMNDGEVMYDDDCEDAGGCPRCWGEGYIVICCDDICRGLDHCIHGDGEIVCPDCESC